MTFGSLFAGIEGFGLGMHRAGMKAMWQVELDAVCRSVCRRHFPDVMQFDDVRRVRAYLEPKNARKFIRPDRPDMLCGGFPCQDISVAGRRAGLAGSRSGLWFVFRRIAALLRPGWLLIENVDGLRSSNGGRDLGAILKALGDMGYGWAYRVFDSQWFGLAQRRERVFIVGCLGNRRLASEVLFERDCVPWNHTPSRETGARVAASLTRGSASGSGVNDPGRRREDDVNIVAFTNRGIATDDLAETQRAGCHGALPMVAHTLRAAGFDGSEDGTGRGVPLVAGFKRGQGESARSDGYRIEQSPTLTAADSGTNLSPGVQIGSSVRRLTPRECERLQGFPDDWTRWDADGNELADSPRYRMLGNAVSVPVAEWIGRRIVEAANQGVSA